MIKDADERVNHFVFCVLNFEDDDVYIDITAANKTEDLISTFVDETSKSLEHNSQYEVIALTYFDIIQQLWKLDNPGAR